MKCAARNVALLYLRGCRAVPMRRDFPYPLGCVVGGFAGHVWSIMFMLVLVAAALIIAINMCAGIPDCEPIIQAVSVNSDEGVASFEYW